MGFEKRYLKNALQKTVIFGWYVNKILEYFGIILLNEPFSTRTAHELVSAKFVVSNISKIYLFIQNRSLQKELSILDGEIVDRT